MLGFGLACSCLQSLSARAEIGYEAWVQRHRLTTNSAVSVGGLAVGANSNVYVTAYLPSDFQSDYVTLAYSNSGVPLWTNRYNLNNDRSVDLAVGPEGNVYVTGSSSGAATMFATVAYSSAGVPLWTNRYFPGTPSALAVGSNGTVYVTSGGSR